MSNQTRVLLASTADNSKFPVEQYSAKSPAAGYYKNNNGMHTAVFEFDNFKGSVKIQATLELYPGDSDWFDVVYDSADVVLTAIDSTPVTNNAVCTFTGKFVYIRAAYQLEEGTITEIRYNH
jgi:hypothetical protein